MKVSKIQEIRDTLERVRMPNEGRCYFVTLNFPSVDVQPAEGDRAIKRYIDMLRKRFADISTVSVMAFSEESALHYHLIIFDYGAHQRESVKIGRWIRTLVESHEYNESMSWMLERDVLVSPIEAVTRQYWFKATKKYFGKDLNDKTGVHFCLGELGSGTLIEYITRPEERNLPWEWSSEKVTWVRHWGRSQIILEDRPHFDFCDLINQLVA